jgi:predicted dehydrogenase
MEAFMYRCHPQTAKLTELVCTKAIGDVRLIQCSFAFASNPAPDHRLLNLAMGGGGILDVGCYAMSMARLLAGAAAGKPFAEPAHISGEGVLGSTGVDEIAVAALSFPGGVLAQITTGFRLAHDNFVRIYGSEGAITVPSPWIPGREAGTTAINVQRYARREAEEVRITTEQGLYTLEADAVARNIANGEAPEMTLEDSLGNMAVLDRWRKAVGVEYEADRKAARTRA